MWYNRHPINFYDHFSQLRVLNNISFEQYPIGYLLFCLLAGLAYSAILYFRDKNYSEIATQQRWVLWLMSLLRFLAVSTIAFLLLAPLIRNKFTEIIKPLIIVAQDNSESLAKNFGNADSSRYRQQLQQLASDLSADYTVQTYNFGGDTKEGLRFDYTAKTTDIAQCLDQITNAYTNQNVGAIVLATDGIYNQGNNPLYTNTKANIPIYAIALGDTTPRRDVLVAKVLHNRIAYLGDKFTLRADVAARNCSGSNTILTVYKGDQNGTKVFSKPITIKNNNFVQTEDIVLEASSPGIVQYTVQVQPVKDEITTQNNTQTVYIEVIDSRRKVLILADSPHPDIAAIRQALEANKNYETTAAFADKFNTPIRNFDMVILHGLPSQKYNITDIISQIKAASLPVWYVLSTQTSVPLFNSAQNLLQINGSGAAANDVKAIASADNIDIFTVDNAMLQTLQELPPLAAPFGEYKAGANAQTLLKQKIGTVSTQYPLLTIEQSANSNKTAVLCGEGFWRWRIYDFKKDQSHEATNELVSKVAQYLSAKNDKRKFRVSTPKALYYETEQIIFDAELYNDSYERVNTPEVSLTVYNAAGKAFPFVMNRTSNAYTLNAGFLPIGKYTYEASTTYNNTPYKASGSFSVVAIQLETLQTAANHSLLFSLAQQFGGEVVYPDSVSTLLQQIKTKEEIKPVLYNTYKTQPIINLRWLLAAIIAFLGLEWFLRKYLGGY